MIFRLLLLTLGATGLAASLAIDRPERFAIIWPAALMIVLLAAGSIAAHAIPLQRVGLACAIATFICGLGLFIRGEVQIPLTAVIVGLQVVAIAAPRMQGLARPRSHAGFDHHGPQSDQQEHELDTREQKDPA